jgi:hypothetical protein
MKFFLFSIALSYVLANNAENTVKSDKQIVVGRFGIPRAPIHPVGFKSHIIASDIALDNMATDFYYNTLF